MLTYPRPGLAGLVFFAGNSLLDRIISAVSKDRKAQGITPVHVAMIDPVYGWEWYNPEHPLIFEDTIGGGKDGAQLNLLEDRLSGRVWLCEFTDELLANLNWNAANQFMLSSFGKRYNVGELPADLALDVLKIPGRICSIAQTKNASVCSELVLLTLIAAGIQKYVKVPMPFGSSPQEVAELPLYKSCKQIYGPAAPLRGFKAAA